MAARVVRRPCRPRRSRQVRFMPRGSSRRRRIRSGQGVRAARAAARPAAVKVTLLYWKAVRNGRPVKVRQPAHALLGRPGARYQSKSLSASPVRWQTRSRSRTRVGQGILRRKKWQVIANAIVQSVCPRRRDGDGGSGESLAARGEAEERVGR